MTRVAVSFLWAIVAYVIVSALIGAVLGYLLFNLLWLTGGSFAIQPFTVQTLLALVKGGTVLLVFAAGLAGRLPGTGGSQQWLSFRELRTGTAKFLMVIIWALVGGFAVPLLLSIISGFFTGLYLQFRLSFPPELYWHYLPWSISATQLFGAMVFALLAVAGKLPGTGRTESSAQKTA